MAVNSSDLGLYASRSSNPPPPVGVFFLACVCLKRREGHSPMEKLPTAGGVFQGGSCCCRVVKTKTCQKEDPPQRGVIIRSIWGGLSK